MAKKTKVRQHERATPRRQPAEKAPEEQVRDFFRKENEKNVGGFKEWETVRDERKR